MPGRKGIDRTIDGGVHFLQEDAREELAALLLEYTRRTGGR
jgi:hypothetical protein